MRSKHRLSRFGTSGSVALMQADSAKISRFRVFPVPCLLYKQYNVN